MFDVSQFMPNDAPLSLFVGAVTDWRLVRGLTPPLCFDIHLSNKASAIAQLGSKREGWIIRGNVKLNSEILPQKLKLFNNPVRRLFLFFSPSRAPPLFFHLPHHRRHCATSEAANCKPI